MKVLIFLLIGSVLQSCDPMRRINIVNDSGGDAQITWTIKEDSILFSPLFISNNPEVNFYLRPNQNNEINMSFGMGNWSMQALTNLVDDLESLELKWVGGTIKITDADSIKNFLANRRMGLDNRKIKIRFSNYK